MKPLKVDCVGNKVFFSKRMKDGYNQHLDILPSFANFLRHKSLNCEVMYRFTEFKKNT